MLASLCLPLVSFLGLVKRIYSDKDVVIYDLPGGNICVPTIVQDGIDSYTHVMRGKVNLKQYKST